MFELGRCRTSVKPELAFFSRCCIFACLLDASRFFVAGQGQLNKAHVQYLEAQLVNRARAAKRMPLDNGNVPAEPTLSEADRADMNVFLDNLLGIFPVLGIHAFEQSPAQESRSETSLLMCHGKGITATGCLTLLLTLIRT
jgi:hypothetical protein